MKRREVIALLGGAAAWPLAARAQQSEAPEIGIINSVSFAPLADRLDAFFEGLAETGFVEGRNLAVEYRSAEGQAGRLPALAADLAQRNCKVIVCMTSANTVHAAKAATSTIPIVFAITGDPVELGLVANRERPEANVTGAGRVTEALNPERLKLICELVPQSSPVGFLLNTDFVTADTTGERIRQMESIARALGRRLVVMDLAGKPDIVAIFDSMARQGIAAFVISAEALFNVWRDQVIALSAGYRIAAMFPNREYALAGGLISYGANFYVHYRVAGTYTGRILKGEKPADLPVQLPTKYETVLNLNTAKLLGLDVPASVLARATEVIE